VGAARYDEAHRVETDMWRFWPRRLIEEARGLTPWNNTGTENGNEIFRFLDLTTP
jgi:hypothetical protein